MATNLIASLVPRPGREWLDLLVADRVDDEGLRHCSGTLHQLDLALNTADSRHRSEGLAKVLIDEGHSSIDPARLDALYEGATRPRTPPSQRPPQL